MHVCDLNCNRGYSPFEFPSNRYFSRMTKLWRRKCYLSELRGTRSVTSFDSMSISTWNLQSLVHTSKVWANADYEERFVGLLLKQKAKTKSDALYPMYLCLHFSWVSSNNWPIISHQICIFKIFPDAEQRRNVKCIHREKKGTSISYFAKSFFPREVVPYGWVLWAFSNILTIIFSAVGRFFTKKIFKQNTACSKEIARGYWQNF